MSDMLFTNPEKKKQKNKGFYMILAACVLTIALTGYTVMKENNMLAQEQNEKRLQAEDDLKKVNEEILKAEAEKERVLNEEFESSEVGILWNTKKEDPKPQEKTEAPKSSSSGTAKAETPAKPKQELYIKPAAGTVLSQFSAEELTYSETLKDYRAHLGIDFAGDIGTPVRAVADGEVIEAGYDELAGYYVLIQHASSIRSYYANLQQGLVVKAGDLVKQGDAIGGIGASSLVESNSPPHVHFELLKDGEQIDPFSLIKK